MTSLNLFAIILVLGLTGLLSSEAVKTCNDVKCNKFCQSKLGSVFGYCIGGQLCYCSPDSIGHGCPDREQKCNQHCVDEGRKSGWCSQSGTKPICWCSRL